MSDEQDQWADFDRDFLQPNRTPPLRAVELNFKSNETPPPLVDPDSTSDSTFSEREEAVPARRRKRRKGRDQPAESDAVLIRQLAPNRPDIADQAAKHVLDSASEAEEEDQDSDERGEGDQMSDSDQEKYGASKTPTVPKDIAVAALEAIDDHDPDVPVADSAYETADRSQAPRATVVLNGADEEGDDADDDDTDDAVTADDERPRPSPLHPAPSSADCFKAKWNLAPPPRPPRLHVDASRLRPGPTGHEDDDSIATSPALAKFAMTPQNADPEMVLPAMQQKSPPRLSSTTSPETKQTLPSLTTALSQISETNSVAAFPNRSPGLNRPSPGQMSQFGPSPSTYSQPSPNLAMSPPSGIPSIPPHPSHYRTNTRDSISTPSDYASASATASTPASSILTQSPASSYPPSTSAPSEHDKLKIQDESAVPPEPGAHMSNGIHPLPPSANSTYKCTVPGCNASPFQTQYLLNSHMNVHSNQRPHFCPVEGCSRGPGGQGFKRKNEMIR